MAKVKLTRSSSFRENIAGPLVMLGVCFYPYFLSFRNIILVPHLINSSEPKRGGKIPALEQEKLHSTIDLWRIRHIRAQF